MTNSANEMAVFERVITRGNFAAAAEDVGLSPSAVSKLISRLESRLGVRLINRTTRRLSLTTEGDTYLKRSREILAAIELAESELASARLSPRGHLRVQAPPVMIEDHFAPALSGFMARYPRITIEFLVANRVVDIVAEKVDIAMRAGDMPDSALIAVKIVDLSQIVCASPDYLARHGRPLSPSDLNQHQCLTLSSSPAHANWLFHKAGKAVSIKVNGPVSADSSDVLVKLAVDGVGIVRLGELAVARALINGSLVALLEDVQLHEGYPLWAVLPPGRQRSPKVRVFLEFLAETLSRAPWRSVLTNAKKH
jgi:DNA-binding transcriptional LysR family regulator